MQIQVGKGPHASEVSGIVKIGQTMTMVLGVKDDENKFDMMVSSGKKGRDWSRKQREKAQTDLTVWPPRFFVPYTFQLTSHQRHGV